MRERRAPRRAPLASPLSRCTMLYPCCISHFLPQKHLHFLPVFVHNQYISIQIGVPPSNRSVLVSMGHPQIFPPADKPTFNVPSKLAISADTAYPQESATSMFFGSTSQHKSLPQLSYSTPAINIEPHKLPLCHFLSFSKLTYI